MRGKILGSSRIQTETENTSTVGKIHPVIIYPFVHPSDPSDLEELYRFVEKLNADPETYARPITVMDRKTHGAAEWSQHFMEFRCKVVEKQSRLIDAWCVDTCQMWYTGLGVAFEEGAPGDAYWLIPGDFNYGSPTGKEVLERLPKLPQLLLKRGQDVYVGEVIVDASSSKQLIDTYGTWALLYHWFPQEAVEIRKTVERPRSEFFAVTHAFLKDVLQCRWYAYEQTLVILLHAITEKKHIGRLTLGDISDLPQGRDSLNSAISQVERTERALRQIWRESNPQTNGWKEKFASLSAGSDEIRRAALTLLSRILG